MCDKNNYGAYNSDSDFSDIEDSEMAPALPKKLAPTLMDVLCSDGKDPNLCLSPRASGDFLSFSEGTRSSPAFSDQQKTGLFEQKVLPTEDGPQVRFFAPKLEQEEKREPVLRQIPMSSLQQENMRRFEQPSSN